MLYHAGRVSKSQDDTDQVLRRARPGLQRFSASAYRGWRYAVWRRELGMTIQRAVYSASIENPSGEQAAHLRDFRSLEQARRAAEKWIDVACRTQDAWIPRRAAEREFRPTGSSRDAPR
jgi:hypothetical protein